jgi:CheY-like chemotaxis protein
MKLPTVLIVEDDLWLAEQYSRIISSAGYKTTTASNAQSAIQMIDDNQPDAIILDMLLTGSTAIALLHELQSYGDTCVIPIIICTNLASELSLDNLRSYGVRQIIDKTTMAPNDLIIALQDVMT